MKKEATIYDIANKLNLSASTVSRALQNNKIINIETRKKVQECATEMGYRSNAFASNLRTQKTNTIGIIVPRLDSSFMSSCLAGMEEVANEKGYTLIISQSHESVKREKENTTTMFNKRVDGLLASLTIEDSDLSYFNRFADKKVPVVFFDRVPDKTNNLCFVIDNYKVSYEATQHLIDQGKRQLVHLTIKANSNVYVERKNGFIDAIKANNNCEGEVLYLNTLSIESGKEIVNEILKREPKPDGVFASNDTVAVGCILGLNEKSIPIPNDIAVVGFNNDPIATIISPELSTVAYPGKELGRIAARSLIDHLIGEQNIELTQKVMLDSALIIRESSSKK